MGLPVTALGKLLSALEGEELRIAPAIKQYFPRKPLSSWLFV